MEDLRELGEVAVKLATDQGATYADARVDRYRSTLIRYLHDALDQANTGVTEGFGIRILYNDAWGFATVVQLEKPVLKKAVNSAVRAAKTVSRYQKEKIRLGKTRSGRETVRTPGHGSLEDIALEDKMKLCESLVNEARSYHKNIASANGLYIDSIGQRVVVNTDGTSVVMEDSRLYYSVRAIAREGDKTVSTLENHGLVGRGDVFAKVAPDRHARIAAQRAIACLDGKPCPSKRLPVVMDPKLAGVFIHEAVGHAAEADGIIAKESILEGRIGQTIGSELLSAYDDSTLYGGWGSSKYDDEGTLAGKRTIVEKGVLRGYILNREAAAKLHMEPNGGARAESYAHTPVVRMSNTYIASGDQSLEELIEDVDYGVYMKGTRGGQVDPSKGTFQFNAEDAQLIEKGELTAVLLEASLSGDTLTILNAVDGVGREVSHDAGFCGKASQSVAAGTGGPHVRVKETAVGGKA